MTPFDSFPQTKYFLIRNPADFHYVKHLKICTVWNVWNIAFFHLESAQNNSNCFLLALFRPIEAKFELFFCWVYVHTYN